MADAIALAVVVGSADSSANDATAYVASYPTLCGLVTPDTLAMGGRGRGLP